MKPSESPPQPANRSMKRTCPLLFLPAIQVRFLFRYYNIFRPLNSRYPVQNRSAAKRTSALLRFPRRSMRIEPPRLYWTFPADEPVSPAPPCPHFMKCGQKGLYQKTRQNGQVARQADNCLSSTSKGPEHGPIPASRRPNTCQSPTQYLPVEGSDHTVVLPVLPVGLHSANSTTTHGLDLIYYWKTMKKSFQFPAIKCFQFPAIINNIDICSYILPEATTNRPRSSSLSASCSLPAASIRILDAWKHRLFALRHLPAAITLPWDDIRLKSTRRRIHCRSAFVFDGWGT